MASVQRKRPKIGDVLEIGTPKGFAYLQYTNRDPTYGALIRVLPGVYQQRPSAFSDLVRERERFFIFFPVGAAVNREIVTIVANEDIPAHAREIPPMRAAGGIDRNGHVLNWWLIEKGNKRMVNELTTEQRNLSLAEAWNDTMLIQRIVEGWSPSDYV